MRRAVSIFRNTGNFWVGYITTSTYGDADYGITWSLPFGVCAEPSLAFSAENRDITPCDKSLTLSDIVWNFQVLPEAGIMELWQAFCWWSSHGVCFQEIYGK